MTVLYPNCVSWSLAYNFIGKFDGKKLGATT